jgi:hypothetical protein
LKEVQLRKEVANIIVSAQSEDIGFCCLGSQKIKFKQGTEVKYRLIATCGIDGELRKQEYLFRPPKCEKDKQNFIVIEGLGEDGFTKKWIEIREAEKFS